MKKYIGTAFSSNCCKMQPDVTGMKKCCKNPKYIPHNKATN